MFSGNIDKVMTYRHYLSQVYDKDRVVSDDFMGQAHINISTYELERSHELELGLQHGEDPTLVK